MSRDMNINPKSAFVLLHKLREDMGAVVHSGDELAGDVEVDGAYFGSRTRLANRVADRRQQRRENSKRQVVVIARQRGLGPTVPWVVSRESEAVPLIRQVVAKRLRGSCRRSFWMGYPQRFLPDEAGKPLFEFKSEDGGCTNEAESNFSRLRHSEFGINHRISGHLLQAYANECAWRENNRRVSNGIQWKWITAAALDHAKSNRWAGCWHRNAR
jgi:hypothetical protein